MTSIADIRAKYPQYDNLSDGDLLIGLHRKFYPEMHPRQFLNSIEGGDIAGATIRDPELKAWYRERVSMPLDGENAQDTERRLYGNPYQSADGGGRLGAGARSFLQGMTFGYGDEVVGRATSLLSGNDPAYEIGMERERLRKGEEQFPVQSAVAEIGGAVATPGAAVKSIPGAIAAGTAGGSLYASGKAEDGRRAEAAVDAILPSALFAAGGVAVQRFAQKGLNRLMQGAEKRPSLGRLKAVRDQAYKAVDNSGFSFTPQQYDDTLSTIQQTLSSPRSGYVQGADLKVEKALRILDKNRGGTKTLGEVDDLRKVLWEIWEASPKDEARNVLGMINQIDDMIEATLGGSPVLLDAREAHKALMRTEYLDAAFRKAENRTAATGSGGNIYNNYARVFEKILDDPKLARKFTPEQLEFFRAAVDAPITERTMRKLGKLSPDGNGLMLALNIIGGSLDPTLFAVGGAGALAKMGADASMQARVDRAIGLTAGMQPPPPRTTPTQIPTAAAVGGLLATD